MSIKEPNYVKLCGNGRGCILNTGGIAMKEQVTCSLLWCNNDVKSQYEPNVCDTSNTFYWEGGYKNFSKLNE